MVFMAHFLTHVLQFIDMPLFFLGAYLLTRLTQIKSNYTAVCSFLLYRYRSIDRNRYYQNKLYRCHQTSFGSHPLNPLRLKTR